MDEFYRMLAGIAYACDAEGNLKKDEDGNNIEVENTDGMKEVSVDDEDVSEEAQKRLKKLIEQNVKENVNVALKDMSEKAIKSFERMEETVESGMKGFKKVNVSTAEKKGATSFDLDAVKKGIEGMREGDRKNFKFSFQDKKELKALTKATSVSGDVDEDLIGGEQVGGVEREPQRPTFIENIADVANDIEGDHLFYVEATKKSNGEPATIAELETYPKADFTFAEKRANLQKIAIMNEHSLELLEDAPQLVSAIRRMLREDLNLKVDKELLVGNSGASEIVGIFNKASELNATVVGDKRIPNANLFDVIRLAGTKIMAGGRGRFRATHVLLNPEDSDELDLTKDADGRYIMPPFVSADGTTVKGARVIENTGIPAGQFLVGDFNQLHIGTKGGVTIDMTNSHSENFDKDILAIKLHRRVAAFVRDTDAEAFYTGDIASVKEALTQSA